MATRPRLVHSAGKGYGAVAGTRRPLGPILDELETIKAKNVRLIREVAVLRGALIACGALVLIAWALVALAL